MIVRAASLAIAILVTGCGAPNGSGSPQAETSKRTWKYYAAHPSEIEPMQKICREWSASNASAAAEPAVIATNCRAASFAKSMLKLQSASVK